MSISLMVHVIVIIFQLIAPDLGRCQTINGAEGGDNSICPGNMVVVGRCGSGGDKDCPGDNSHQTYCCPLKYIGWPI